MPTKFYSRDIGRWKREVMLFGSIDEFMAKPIRKSGIYTIKYGETFLDFMYSYRGTDRLVVSFHPALGSRVGAKVPVFVGQKISGQSANLLFVSDPGLYYGEHISLAWFSGTYSCPFETILPTIVEKFQQESHSSRLIFSGISGGGFAAALYSAMFPGSLALAVNPQTKIWLFGERHVREYLRVCFLDPDPADLEASLRRHITADLSVIYGAPVRNHLIYVQNASDHHVGLHAVPFLETLHEENRGRVKYVEGHHWGTGHVAPPASVLTAMIDSVVTWQDSWDALFESGGIEKLVE